MENLAPASRWDLLALCLAGVILQYVWRVQEVVWPLAYVQFTALVSVGAVGLLVFGGDRNRQLAKVPREMVVPMLAILVFATISVPLSLQARVSYEFLTKNFVKTIVLVIVLAAGIRDRADVDRLVRMLVLGGGGYVLVSLLLASPAMERLGGNGGNGSYDPNDLGLLTVGTLPLCIYLVRRRAPRLDRIAGSVCAVLLLIATARTGSRGAFLALVAIALYCVTTLDVLPRSTRIRAFVAAAVLVLGFGGNAYRERIQTLAAPTEDYNWSGQAESGRVEIWKRGIGYIAQNPLVGVGLNAFFVAEGHSDEAMRRRQEHEGFKWSAAHNSYLQIGAELGIPALFFFVRLLWLSFREARRIGRTALHEDERLLGQCFGALLVGYIVAGSFLSQAYAPFLYFSVGILIGFGRVVREELRCGAELVSETAAAVPTGYLLGSRRRPEGWIRLSSS